MSEVITSERNFKQVLKEDEICDSPYTREGLAVLIAEGEANEFEKQLFHDSIVRAIYTIVFRYGECDTRVPVEELANDAELALWKNLPFFKKEKGVKFITWMWRVVRNHVFNHRKRVTRYRTNQKITTNMSSEESEFITTRACDESLSNADKSWQMKNAMQLLFDAYPEKQKMLLALFGDPFSENFSGKKPNFVRVAKKLKTKMNDVRRFCNHVAYPFLKKHLDDLL